MLGAVRTETYRRYYRYRTLRHVRYINTGTEHFVKLGTLFTNIRTIWTQMLVSCAREGFF